MAERRGVIVVAVLCCSVLPTVLRAQAGTDVLPAPTGPYAIGRVSIHWTDHTREEVETKVAGDKRELMVHIFYPRDASVTGQLAVYLPDADAQQKEWSAPTLTRISAMRTHSREGAAIATGTTRYPVLIFLPGRGMKALMNQVFLEDLASHGYVVAAIDPAYNAPLRFPDGRVLGTLQPAEQGWAELSGDKHDDGARIDHVHVQRVVHWSRDASFVIDRLTALDSETSPFFRRLDLQRGVGVFGVSLGGNAAGTARLLDSRVRAAINLDGYGPDGPYSPVRGPDMGEQPFLWILRQGPRAATWYPDRLLQPIAKGALRVVLDRPGFTHGDFSDEAIWGASNTRAARAAKLTTIAEIREWVKTFFDATVRGEWDDLTRLANRPRGATPNRVTTLGAFWSNKR